MVHHRERYGVSREEGSSQIVVRSVLWVIVAAVVVGFAVWWVMT
jgi:hypothetical protein